MATQGGTKFLLCFIDIYSECAWVEPLHDKSGSSVEKAFEKIFHERVPKKIWADRGREFYNNTVKDFFERKGIELYSTFNEDKSVVTERFIRTLKEKLYWLMTARGTGKYLTFFPEVVEKYNDTVHSRTKQKPSEVKEGSVNYETKENLTENLTVSKFKPGDIVRITKYKNIFKKGFTPNWTKELFKVKERHDTNPWTYSIEDLKGEPIFGTFYE